MSFETLCIMATQMSSYVIVKKNDDIYTVMINDCKFRDDNDCENAISAEGSGRTLDEAAKTLLLKVSGKDLIFYNQCSIYAGYLFTQATPFSTDTPVDKTKYLDILLKISDMRMGLKFPVCVKHDGKGNYAIFLDSCEINGYTPPNNRPYGCSNKLNKAAKSLLSQTKGEKLLAKDSY